MRQLQPIGDERQIFEQAGPNTLPSASGNSAYRLVFRSDPADLSGWGGDDEELLLAKDASLSGQVVLQWTWRILAQGAAPKEVA